MIIFIIKLILMTTGACVWSVIFIIAGGLIAGMVRNKIYQRKKRINAKRMAKERLERWLAGGEWHDQG